ncbi:MAG: tRNA pseudouridine(55) synthase TruB [Bacillota bacterium]|nr:tRNA pseudouridine(55) synthase TruB [Bacillota bacterium]
MGSGILNLLKPPGLTSHDAVQEVRRLFGTRRVGHAGTLDPGAAGVLVVCIGEATKAVAFMEAHEKEYWGEAVLGWATFTQDAEGAVVDQVPEGWETDSARVAAAAARLTGDLEQTAPLVSAVHQGGERLYRLARRGAAVERPLRRVRVERFAVEELLPNSAGKLGAGSRMRFSVTCSRGTYVRALVDEFGRALGGLAYLEFLLRTRSGPFRLAGASTLEELAEESDPARLLVPVERGLLYPALHLGREEAARFRNGAVAEGQAGPPGRRLVYGPNSAEPGFAFLGVGEVDPAGRLRPLRLFGVGEERDER